MNYIRAFWGRYARLPAKLRWRLADHLDTRHADICWSRMCDWALRWEDDDESNSLLPDRRSVYDQTRCREDVERVGCCYCNKLSRDEVAA